MESFWWLPNQPWSAYEKEASQQMMRDLFHIYTDLLPPEQCSVMEKNGKWEIHVDDFRKESTRTEYLFAGNPPLPVRKKCHKLALTWFGKRFCARDAALANFLLPVYIAERQMVSGGHRSGE